MPNHVTSVCTVTGPTADVAAFYEKHVAPGDLRAKPEERSPAFSVETVIPMPTVLRGTISPPRPGNPDNERARTETGFTDWYEWALANWGTKWGTYRFEELERGEDRYVFRFRSAWSFPEPVFRKLAADWPSLVFDCITHDEGDGFGGEGQFNGRNDFECLDDLGGNEALYLRIHGRHKPRYDEDGNEVCVEHEDCRENAELGRACAQEAEDRPETATGGEK